MDTIMTEDQIKAIEDKMRKLGYETNHYLEGVSARLIKIEGDRVDRYSGYYRVGEIKCYPRLDHHFIVLGPGMFRAFQTSWVKSIEPGLIRTENSIYKCEINDGSGWIPLDPQKHVRPIQVQSEQ